MRIQWTVKGYEDSCFSNAHCLLKSQSYWCSHSLRQAFRQCRLPAKKAASSEKASEPANLLDLVSLLSCKLEPGKAGD